MTETKFVRLARGSGCLHSRRYKTMPISSVKRCASKQPFRSYPARIRWKRDREGRRLGVHEGRAASCTPKHVFKPVHFVKDNFGTVFKTYWVLCFKKTVSSKGPRLHRLPVCFTEAIARMPAVTMWPSWIKNPDMPYTDI